MEASRSQVGWSSIALGDDLEAQVPAEVDDRPHDRHVLALAAEAGDEAAVDLDLVDRQALQVGQRRVARAEVVHGQPDAERAQLVQQRDRPRRVGHDRALGHLEGEPRRRDAVPAQQAGHLVDQIGVLEAAGGEVDGDAEVDALPPPVGDRGEGQRRGPGW